MSARTGASRPSWITPPTRSRICTNTTTLTTASSVIVHEPPASIFAGVIEPVRETDRGAVSVTERIAYAGVYMPFSILHAPALAVLPALYAKYAHMPLILIRAGLALARVLDCVLDPVIGFASDRTRSRYGRRKP